MEKDITKRYSNGEVTVIWKPNACIHSKICWTHLSTVFNPNKRPWISMDGSTTAQIIEQVKHCPSGALSYEMNGPEKQEEHTTATEIKVETQKNGPLLIYGNVSVTDSQGNTTRRSKVTAFCRCGASANKPYCDGSHIGCKFEAD